MVSLDHRAYVGGLWEGIGRLQFEFRLRQGLAPSDCFHDIACGSLRGGVHFINYLDPGNYLGIEKQRRLVELGIEKELGRAAFLSRNRNSFGRREGWKPTYSGDWNHPRNQVMMRFEAT
jgi:hypothetical protein